MSAVRVDPPAAVLAERARLGHDRRDEMWEGELHMAPAPSFDHQEIGNRLVVALYAIVQREGLSVHHETGLYDPEVSGHVDYRIPDVMVFSPDLASRRGVEGPASIVVEIRSPGDESFQTLPYYERLGVGEVLIIDKANRRIQRWRNGPDGLVEVPADGRGEVTCEAIPIALRYDAAKLVVTDLSAAEGPTVVARISSIS